jgi:magnesium chelatase family protein
VEVEVDYSNGLPAVIIVGLPDAAVQESRERVQTAVKNAGLNFPRHRIVVNLAPAAVRKEGPAYDLPIALGVMILAGFLPQEAIESTLVIGELSLDGGSATPAVSSRWLQPPGQTDSSGCSSRRWTRAKPP